MPSTTTPIPGTTTAAITNTTRTANRRRIPRRLFPPSPPRLPGAVFALALAAGLALVILAIPRLIAGWLILEHEPTVRRVQYGHPLPLEALIAARRDYEASLLWRAGGQERAALASILLRMANQLGIENPGGRAVLEAARDAVGATLRVRPADPYSWARLAETERLLRGTGPVFQAALLRSIETGPHEPSLLPFRVALGVQSWVALDEGLRQAVAAQIRILAGIDPGPLQRIAKASPLHRRLQTEILSGRPELHARVFPHGTT
jgi:hypothetical protein